MQAEIEIAAEATKKEKKKFPGWFQLTTVIYFFSWHLFIAIGAGILMAIDNKNRGESGSAELGQPEFNYLQGI